MQGEPTLFAIGNEAIPHIQDVFVSFNAMLVDIVKMLHKV